jgi:hypothetical protein
MASIKANTVHFAAVTLSASAGNQTSNAQDISTGYGAEANIIITNGGTGPTIPAQCQIQVSGDGTNYANFGNPLVAGVTNSAVYSWSVELPIGVQKVRLVAGSNTGQNVTIQADVSNVTGV